MTDQNKINEEMKARLDELEARIAALEEGTLTFKAAQAKGGRSTSEAKKAAVRENGKKGGRPKKVEQGL